MRNGSPRSRQSDINGRIGWIVGQDIERIRQAAANRGIKRDLNRPGLRLVRGNQAAPPFDVDEL